MLQGTVSSREHGVLPIKSSEGIAVNMNIPLKPQKQEANKRQYQAIWEAIKAKNPGEAVDVRCHPSAVKTIIQAVKKEKNRDVGIKNKLGMLTAGPLSITHNPEFDLTNKKPTGKVVITFKLQWDGSKL